MLYRSVIVDIATIVVLFSTYFLLAGEVSKTECIAGTMAVLATVAFAIARRRSGMGRLALTVAAQTFLRPLVTLMPDTVQAGQALALAIRFGPSGDSGAFMRQRAPPPEPVGSKGIRILCQSLTPKSFLLGDTDGVEVLHRLAPGGSKGDAA
jgi:hypothetical protein